MKSDNKNEETWGSNVICPVCGHEDIDSWELSLDEDGEITTTICNNCDTELKVQLQISHSYYTVIL